MMNRSLLVVWLLSGAAVSGVAADGSLPNFVIITADDLNWDSVGCYGCPLPEVTPAIDRLASQGMRFEHAHVAAAVCQPSRAAISTGRRGHRSGGEGFFHLRFPNVPTVQQLLHDRGYRVGILGKVAHSTPYADTPWDVAVEMGRNTDEFAESARTFVDESVAAEQPFYLIVNSHDPHRPYFNIRKRRADPDGETPGRIFAPEEVPLHPTLPDHPDVRHEQACYFSSVRRCDDVVDRVVRLLEERELTDNTVIVFLSDHGMAVPSAKSNCYAQSTRTPLIVRWDGHIRPGQVESSHLVSSLDLLPTILDAAQIDNPGGMDGRTLMPLLQGEPQSGREYMFTQYYMKIGQTNYQMRAVQNRDFLFVFNPWYNGKPVYNTSALGGSSFRTMMQLAKSDPTWSERCELLLTRVPEEFFDLRADPNCLDNLIDTPAHAERIDQLKDLLAVHLANSEDPMQEVFDVYRRTGSVEQMIATYQSMWKKHDLPGRVASRPVSRERWTEPKQRRRREKRRRAGSSTGDGESQATDSSAAAEQRRKRRRERRAQQQQTP